MRESVFIALAGREYPMLPTFDAWRQIEELVGPLEQCLHYMQQRRVKADVLADIIMAGLKAAEPNPKFPWDRDAILKAIFAAGPGSPAIWGPAIEFVERLLFTPEDLAKKREAERKEVEDDPMKSLLSALSTHSRP